MDCFWLGVITNGSSINSRTYFSLCSCVEYFLRGSYVGVGLLSQRWYIWNFCISGETTLSKWLFQWALPPVITSIDPHLCQLSTLSGCPFSFSLAELVDM